MYKPLINWSLSPEHSNTIVPASCHFSRHAHHRRKSWSSTGTESLDIDAHSINTPPARGVDISPQNPTFVRHITIKRYIRCLPTLLQYGEKWIEEWWKNVLKKGYPGTRTRYEFWMGESWQSDPIWEWIRSAREIWLERKTRSESGSDTRGYRIQERSNIRRDPIWEEIRFKKIRSEPGVGDINEPTMYQR